MRLCSIEGCEKKHKGHGYCGMHFQRYKKYGDPNFTSRALIGELLEYFYEAIKLETDDCIIWPYSKQSGYGIVRYKGKEVRVHRLALTIAKGEPPEDKPNALHAPGICHNRACFNPRHLRWGSHKDNNADTILDGTEVRGEKHGRAKLTEAQVLEIREDSRLQREIAEEYGISGPTVSSIKTRKSWSWFI